ncbi:hypothetical protein UFOVP247_64 [uncultured Caudovirales phage]|uniref:Uncharacterized protein n=1 Tax=uncultured Caudovirales phage TaxID=2100421 RepID=A0A6J7WSM1_9CAUD|nr:hypothetical protein UFOVP247_64 [uncultured Caudovirales phage]
MKTWIIEKIVLPALVVMPLTAMGIIIWGVYDKNQGLREACTHLGGVYINSETCIAGYNLFIRPGE